MHRPFVVAVAALGISGCSIVPYHLSDPTKIAGIGPKPSEIVKSIRCELVSFFVENKLRSELRASLFKTIRRNYEVAPATFAEQLALLRANPSIDIDSNQFAAISVDYKHINGLTVGGGIDFKELGALRNSSLTNRLGPSITDTRTFQLTQPMVLSQAADLGPRRTFNPIGRKQPAASAFTTAYNAQPSPDEEFYCYKSLFELQDSATLLDAIRDIHALVVHREGWRDYPNFQRIWVGDITLAEWLQSTASDMARNEKTIFDTVESILIGQLNYQFSLNIKPSLEYRYTLTASLINPLVVGGAASMDHNSAFSIFINTPYAAPSVAARIGNTAIKKK